MIPLVTASEAGRAQAENRQASVWRVVAQRLIISANPGISPLKQGIIEGENPVCDPEFRMYDVGSESRVAWECCTKWVVNFI